ncbi:MAG: outer membrane beta-barrel protein [Gammaproteobacteria bacterium]|nr:outer membrane beta-barrel protein [Gammaproteobacteria bacterium]
MMKTLIQSTTRYTLYSVLLITSYSANASDSSDIGFYFGAGISQTTLAVKQQNMALAYGTSPTSSYETNGLGLLLTAGITLDEYLGFEASYTEIGSIALDNGNTQQKMFDADMFNINAILRTPISENISIFGKLGVSYWSTYDEDLNVMESGNGIIYGAGFDFNIYGNNNRTLRVDWQHQEFENITFTDADTITATAIFNF